MRVTVRALAKIKPFEYTVNLPKTEFPMRANAVVNEILVRDRTTNRLYQKQRERTESKEFTLHDGPPYANGELHIGHAMNKILKDIINRYKVLQGFRVHYVPGWDCHGLPIELKALNTLSDKADPISIRRKASQVATQAIEIQKRQFKEWAIMADWENSYRTMDKSYVIKQLEVFREMVGKGLIQRRLRPVYWSSSTATALAEAELEYKDDHVSKAVYVKIPLKDSGEESVLSKLGISPPNSTNQPPYLLIWTTTPWTLPANVAVSVNANFDYSIIKFAGELLIISAERAPLLKKSIFKDDELQIISNIPGSSLVGLQYEKIFGNGARGHVIAANFVTNDSGTGLVHTAPSHGFEDYEACRDKEFPIISLVDEHGRYMEDVGPELAGLDILNEGNSKVIDILAKRGRLVHCEDHVHKYPFDWRTKKPVIIRATKQWFVDLDKIKSQAKISVDNVKIIPSNNRLRSYIDSRSEWCISRQRSWGVPIPAFYDTERDGEILLNTDVIDHYVDLLKIHGSGCWWTFKTSDLLPKQYRERKNCYEKCTDTMDVWFDSGCSWKTLPVVADLYMEGSDQHRGWFQSSLLTSVAVQSCAPYKTLITHGFVLDEKGRKMSKSLGNVINPSYITHLGVDPKTGKKRHGLGSDALRLWVASVDYKKDVVIGDAIIKSVADVLRKIRNTCRFMLANMSGFVFDSQKLDYKDLRDIDKYMLAELAAFAKQTQLHYDNYDIEKVYKNLINFTSSELSGFYFELSKDILYNEHLNSARRISAQTTLYHILGFYSQALAPLVPHLAEEVFYHFKKIGNLSFESFFEQKWLKADDIWNDERLLKDFRTARKLREHINSAIETAILQKRINNINEASVRLNVTPDIAVVTGKFSSRFADFLMVSKVETMIKNLNAEGSIRVTSNDMNGGLVQIEVGKTNLYRCPRCWRHVSLSEDTLCSRCQPIVDNWSENNISL